MDKNFIFLFVGRIIQAIISIAFLRIATTILDKDQMGTLYIFFSIISYFGIVLINPVGQFINRKIHDWAKSRRLISNLIIFNFYSIIVVLLCSAIIYFLKRYFGILQSVSTWKAVLFSSLGVYANTWVGTSIPALNMLNYRKSFVLISTANLGLSLGLAIFLVKMFERTAEYWFFGQIIGFQLVASFIALILLVRLEKGKINFDQILSSVSQNSFKAVWKFCFPLAKATLFMWLLSDSYRFIVERNVGLSFLGSLGVGLAIPASIMSVAESLFQQIYYPIFYEKINSSDISDRREALRNLFDTSMPFFFLTTLFICFMAPFVTMVLASDKFHDAYTFVILGSWLQFFRVLTNILSMVSHSEMNTKKLIAPYFVGGVVALIGVYLISQGPYYYLGIPFVLLSSNALTAIVMKTRMKTLLSFKFDFRLFVKVFLSSIPFLISLLFLSYSRQIIPSVLIVGCVDIYYLIVLRYIVFNRLFKRRKILL